MKKWMANIALVLGSLLFALALFEVALRMIGFSHQGFRMFDEVAGFRLRPGAEGWFRDEGEAYIKINSDGLRDREHDKKKPADTVRIAVLGDSFVEALQVPMEKTFWFMLEQQLNACKAFGAKKIEVINFGVSGYGTDQELITLRHHAWLYSPDIVLLAFTTGNDVRNNSKVLESEKRKPFYVIQNDDLVLDQSFADSRLYKLKSSVPWQMAEAALGYSRTLQLMGILKNRFTQPKAVSVVGQEAGLDDNVYHEPQDADWRDAWRVTEALIARVRADVKAKGARMLLVTLSNGIQVYPDPAVRKQFMQRTGITDLLYPDKRVKSFADGEGIETIMLAPVFLGYAEKNHVFLHGFNNTQMGFGHWNELGHRLAGDALAGHFCSSSPH